MKKLFTLFAAALLTFGASAQKTYTVYWEDGLEAANAVTTSDGIKIQITGNESKNLGGGNKITMPDGSELKAIKVSNGAQNTLTMPEGEYAGKVTFYSYVNKASDAIADARTSYWKEVNGVAYEGPTMACPNDKPVETPDVNSYELGGVASFTFTNTGEQVVYVAVIETSEKGTEPGPGEGPLWTATGALSAYPEDWAGWDSSLNYGMGTKGIKVEYFGDYTIIRGWCGVEGVDIAVGHPDTADAYCDIYTVVNVKGDEILDEVVDESGYYYVETGLADYPYAAISLEYEGSKFAGIYVDSEAEKHDGIIYMSYVYLLPDLDWTSYTSAAYCLVWPEENATEYETPEETPVLYTAVGQTAEDPEWVGYQANLVEGDLVVEAHESYVVIKDFDGVAGYNLKAWFDAEENVTRVTVVDPEGTEASATLDWVYSGKNYWYVNIEYSSAASDPEAKTGYVELGVYAGSADNFVYYYVTWPKAAEPQETTSSFLWYNPAAEDEYVAAVGAIEQKNGTTNRLNYSNTALGTLYKTICLNGKKANIDDEDGSDNACYMIVTPAEALAEGDVIKMSAYRNKNDVGKGASAYLLFNNGATTTIGGADGLGFVNLNADGDTPDATEPNELTYTVTAAEAGATSFRMTRDKASTNLFITKLEVVPAKYASISEVIAEPAQNTQMFNLAGQKVGADYKGFVIMNGKKMILR